MKRECTFLVTSDELQIIAAASGLSRVLLFQTELPFDRSRQIQAVYRLIRDGFFTQDEKGLKPGPQLIPFIKAFKCAKNIAVHPSGTDAPSLCVYYDESNHEYATISPCENKDDTYKLNIENEGALIEDLESLNILPSPHNGEVNLHGTLDEGIREKANEMSAEWKRSSSFFLSPENNASVFERYSLADGKCIDRLIIFRESSDWIAVVCNDVENRCFYYSRDELTNWLRGI